jgi:DNA repair protein RecN (Recombination protein N)
VLRELRITGLGVIDDLDLELHPGLNVLTGETGAGKTMVTVGISLALGARGAASLVRQGAPAARIQARFDVPEPAADPVVVNGEAQDPEDWAEDGEMILARSIGADGRSSARIGGQLATASALGRLGRGLVELHGQHQAQRLIEPAQQTAFLDRFAGDAHMVALAGYRETYEGLRSVRATLDELRGAARDRERELDLLAFQVNEIETTAPQPDESPSLAAEEARLSHVERLLEEADVAGSTLSGDDGVVDAVAAVAAALDGAAGLDPTAAELASRTRGLAAEVAELARDVRDYRESLAIDPQRLQEVRERMGALKTLQRKYGETDLDVLAFLEEASARLAALTWADERLVELEARADTLASAASEGAARVTAGRTAAAPTLAEAIGGELEDLGMPGARVELVLEPTAELTVSGAERGELRFAPGPGQSMQPLAKTASGGELSRTMLACRSVLVDLDDIPTLVFDEVDAGIGGAAGLAVGRRLARLAQSRQVIVVTHLPQIACFADRHIRVRKGGGTATAQVLDDGERVAELSRMLAGLAQSESAVSHAQELLDEAAKAKTSA